MPGDFRSTREVILRTEEWRQAVEFYANVLRLPVAHADPQLVGLETGAVRLYVEKGRGHPPVFEFLVPDVAAAKAHLLAAGCVVVEEDLALPRCYIRDPYGLIFNLGVRRGAQLKPPDLALNPHSTTSERPMVAPPPALYRAWTDGFERWFAVPGTARIRPEVDAPFFWETQQQGRRYAHLGRFVRLVPDRLVELTWMTSGTRGVETLVTVSLTANGSGSDLRLVHAGFADFESMESHRQAWPHVLGHLDATIRA